MATEGPAGRDPPVSVKICTTRGLTPVKWPGDPLAPYVKLYVFSKENCQVAQHISSSWESALKVPKSEIRWPPPSPPHLVPRLGGSGWL